MKTYITLAVSALMALTTTFTSCSDVTLENAPYSEPVSNLTYSLSKKDLTVSWTSPAGADEIAVFLDNSQKATLPASTTSYTFKNVADGNEHIFTVKAIYTAAGRISEGVSITETLESKTKAAFLLPTGVASYTALPDDDELAAGEVFNRLFVEKEKGQFIHVSDIAGLDIEVTPVIWVMVDRVHIGKGVDKLPYTAAEINTLKEYVKKGGNLYLSNHATQIATGIGRIQWDVTEFNDGEGGEHGDLWVINNVIGSGMGTPINWTAHPIFDGISTENHNGWPQKTVGLLGPGSHEDHNCFWVTCVVNPAWGGCDGINTINKFEEETVSQVMATWGHVQDYFAGGLIEFLPTGDYKGTVLCNGFAAYEFNQNKPASTDKNVFQNNIEKLTENAINYLK